MPKEYSKYSLAKTKEVFSKDEVFQTKVMEGFFEERWADLNYNADEKASSYDKFVRFLLEYREEIAEVTIEEAILDETQELRILMLASMNAETRAINDFGFIPQEVFRQILYSYK